MKPSQYNYTFRFQGQAVLVYNTLTTALVSLDEQEFTLWQAFVAEPQPGFFEAHGLIEWRDQLLEMGMIVPDGANEFQHVRAMHREKGHSDRWLSLTIMPTLDCNFQCGYCFSYARKERMSARVQQALLDLVAEKLGGVDGLGISWFGGEPTLCLDLIEDLSGRIQALCQQHQVKPAEAGIVTNGYLLDESVARRLRAAGVTRAQVTLDGDRQVHNRRRRLRNGHGTFDRILDNLVASSGILEIQMRINVDRSNAETAHGALDALAARGLQGKVAITFGQVQTFTEACSGVQASCFTNQEFGEAELRLTLEALQRGFGSIPYPYLRVGGACRATQPLNFVVAPDGLLFTCWTEASVGEDWAVGSLLRAERTPHEEENLRRYLAWDPTAHPECRSCRQLPICMGGCPHHSIRYGVDADCRWRYSLLETLALRYLMTKAEPHPDEKQAAPAAGGSSTVPLAAE